ALTVEFEMPDVAIPPPDPAKTIGIDLGLIDFVTERAAGSPQALAVGGMPPL
ncbi:MAG: hypothetical protein IRY99_02845, partial [Isosphaeraceae bacterium]|nr:hypothetical protein [Isosphaeraceae bacterium]